MENSLGFDGFIYTYKLKRDAHHEENWPPWRNTFWLLIQGKCNPRTKSMKNFIERFHNNARIILVTKKKRKTTTLLAYQASAIEVGQVSSRFSFLFLNEMFVCVCVCFA